MIDYNTCTMNDVIAHSYLMHPSLLADSLSDVADIHNAAALSMRFDRPAARIAGEMAEAARDMVASINADRIVPASLTFSARIIAFGVACKLLCVPGASSRDIASRG